MHSKLLAVSQGFHSEASVLLPCAEKQGSGKVALEEGQRPHGSSQSSGDAPVQSPEDTQHWMSSHQVLVNLEVLWPLEGGEGVEEGQGCRVLAPECSQVYKLLIQHQHPGHNPAPSHYHFSCSRVPQPSGSILSHTGDKACGGLTPTHYGLNCVLLKFICGIPS